MRFFASIVASRKFFRKTTFLVQNTNKPENLQIVIICLSYRDDIHRTISKISFRRKSLYFSVILRIRKSKKFVPNVWSNSFLLCFVLLFLRYLSTTIFRLIMPWVLARLLNYFILWGEFFCRINRLLCFSMLYAIPNK